ncbi:uncharacterized protein CDV56_100926 [Aspergillus thermomutatus]|uniref:Uncharacterized protein n=1 Tax=Aspergillus thermomutatus TaxID=41047 RepID=A0A397G1Q2_ASPTH|nr:uncharacterized protein CDV56_100926 [Aspergillus thermomutatus]RHZ43226.1 hypothetical protein CDV56_100926 [Aspergillus thermomutatus]
MTKDLVSQAQPSTMAPPLTFSRASTSTSPMNKPTPASGTAKPLQNSALNLIITLFKLQTDRVIHSLREIYEGEDLVFPDTFEHSDTSPPVQYLTWDSHHNPSSSTAILISHSVEAPDDMTVEELYEVEVPPGLMVRIEELPQ